MSTFVYLSNEASDISGYLKAYIGGRPLKASTTISTTVTNTTGSGTHIQMTLTAGGTVAKWITCPLKSAVTIAAKPFNNYWGLESNASANAEIQFEYSQYTTSFQAAFLTTKLGTELGTSAARANWASTESVTSTAFSAGDRLAIAPYIVNNGTMGSSQTVTMDYNGLTTGIDGDTYCIFDEDIQAGASQWSDGKTPTVPGMPGLQSLETLKFNLTQYQGILWQANWRSEDIINELANQEALRTA